MDLLKKGSWFFLAIFVVACGGGFTASKIDIVTDVDAPIDFILSSKGYTDINNVSYQLTVQPKNGSLSGTIPSLTYKPNTGFLGVEEFEYVAIERFPNDPDKDDIVTDKTPIIISVIDPTGGFGVKGMIINSDYIAVRYMGQIESNCNADFFYLPNSESKNDMLANVIESYLTKRKLEAEFGGCESLDGANSAAVVMTLALQQ